MITGEKPSTRIHVYINGTGFEAFEEIVNIEITRGGLNFGPYRGGPDVGTAVVNCYYPPGTSIFLAGLIVGEQVEIASVDLFPTITVDDLFVGILQDFQISYVLDEASGEFGQRLTLFAFDQVGEIQKVAVPGIITSATTKNVSWETRMNTLGALMPGGSFTMPTTPESHIFRLVDNNVDGSLADQLDLACNSVGATWLVTVDNEFAVYKKGAYATTGCLFTDDPNYWNSGNKPANAGSTIFYNLTFKEISYGSDTANLANTVDMLNIMPRNMITRTSGGALVYKDPATIPGPALPVLEQPYTDVQGSSVATYGTRRRSLRTNVYPYRTTDTDSYYVRFNGYIDPGTEYQTIPEMYSSSNVALALVSNVTPYEGTYCTNIKMRTAGIQSFQILLGPSGGFPLRAFPISNINPFTFYFRTSNAKTRYFRGIIFYDSQGNVLQTQTGATLTPTLNTWVTNNTVFMNYLTIPADAVSWVPIVAIQTSDGTAFPLGEIFKIDRVAINPALDTVSYFSGDNADTTSELFSWEGTPGESASYQTRNILDDIGGEVLTYWDTSKANIRSITWNARQNWSAVAALEVGARIDVRFQGVSYASWISKMRYRIDTEDILVTLDLSARPASWI